MQSMRFLPSFGLSASEASRPDAAAPDAGSDAPAKPVAEPVVMEESSLLKTVGWVSAALGAVAIGVIVGREIRQRYKFNRRTPYDLYAHSGDKLPDADWSVGI
jgi:hypothetical protein